MNNLILSQERQLDQSAARRNPGNQYSLNCGSGSWCVKVVPECICLASLCCFPLHSSAIDMHIVRPEVYSGMADASGAVPVGSNLFIVASDEDNVLRLYSSERGGKPIKEFDFSSFLDLRGKSAETDLEAGARIGNRAFWIGSHGANRDAKGRPNRRRFFATDITMEGGPQVNLTPVGEAYEGLMGDLAAQSRFDRFHLAEAAGRSPKTAGALAIEGISATPDRHLLIGFRNPIPDDKALIIPLLNPDEVIFGRRARFGEAIQLDLDGLGIRDLALCEHKYVIIAGSYRGGGKFRLYSWEGAGTKPKQIQVKHLGDYTPEAILLYPNKGLGEFQILSDDGARIINGVPRKDFHSTSKLTFRGFWLVQKQ